MAVRILVLLCAICGLFGLARVEAAGKVTSKLNKKKAQEEILAPPVMPDASDAAPMAPDPEPFEPTESVDISDMGSAGPMLATNGCCPSSGGDCGEMCRDCGKSMFLCFCPRPWIHRTSIFGDFLYLQARGANVAYAQPRDGLDPTIAVPVGPTAVVAPDYRAAYRVGGTIAIDECSSVIGSFTSFESRAGNAIGTDVPFSLNSLVTHPNTASAASNSLQAQARYDIDFRLADASFRALLRGGPRWALNYQIGARYAHLNQQLFTQQPISPGITSVNTNINFEGGGPRVGIDFERYAKRCGLYAYSKAFANFVAGQFRADYLQQNTFALTQAQTSWKDDRIVSILEFEAGLGWTSPRGRLRLTGGYYVAGWFNTVTTPGWIAATQGANFTQASDTLTFDGLVTRAEWRW